jgi:hypothetical protein
MDKDARNDASGWEIGRQERNLSFVVSSKAYMFQEEYVVIEKKTTKPFFLKGPKNSYNMFWIVRKEHRKDFHKPWKRGRKI